MLASRWSLSRRRSALPASAADEERLDALPSGAAPLASALGPRRRVLGGRPLGWLLTAGVVVVGVVFALLVTADLAAVAAPVPAAARVPLWSLVAAAVVADLAVLRVPVRRELHDLGLQGGVAAVGLLTTPVLEVVLALCLGRALALALVRDAAPAQVVSGTARTGLAALLAGTTQLLVAPGAVVPDPHALGGVVLAVLVKTLVGVLLSVGAAAAEGQEQSRRLVLEYAGAAALLGLAAAGLGAGAVVLLEVAGPSPVLLLLAPAVLLVLVGVGWARGRRASGDLAAVRRAARTLTSAPRVPDPVDPAGALLVAATRALRVGRGELLLEGELPGEPVRSYLHVEGVAPPTGPGEPDEVALAALDALRRTPLLLPRLEPGDLAGLEHLEPALTRWLLVRGYPDLVAAPVHVDGAGVGALVVSGRPRSAPRLDASDLVLLSALAEQLGVQVGTARLSRRLGRAEASREELEQRVSSDDLTGLARRPLFADRVEQALSQRGAAGHVAVLFVDLDGFKAINDRLGHAAGDTVLRTISGRLAALLRGGDTAARLGGDEFAVLVQGLEGEDRATLVAARLLDALSLPVPVDEQAVAVQASVGIAVAVDGDSVASLLADADAAMYEAKRAGGSRWVLSSRRPRTTAEALSPRVEQLVQGLSGPTLPGALEVHYQPCVDLADGRVVAVEALVRWRHPELGLLAPAEFVPLAERLGRLAPLGHEVLRRALAQLSAWDAAGAPGLVVHVNLAASELRDPGLLDAVAGALAAAGLSGDRLVLEVGEAVVGEEVDDLVPVMDRLGALGVRWALDGFGVGAVPLGRLDRLPLSSVKIPAGLLGEPGAAASSGLSAGLVGLARSLGLEVVVEGVERAAQDERVRGLRCDRAQGYHYGRPEPAADLPGGPPGRAARA